MSDTRGISTALQGLLGIHIGNVLGGFTSRTLWGGGASADRSSAELALSSPKGGRAGGKNDVTLANKTRPNKCRKTCLIPTL